MLSFVTCICDDIIDLVEQRFLVFVFFQNKTCVQTLEGHAQNVSTVLFHPELPIVLSGSEDGTVRIWHANTHRLESTLNYGMERVWAMSAMKGTNNVAIGYDEGSIIVKVTFPNSHFILFKKMLLFFYFKCQSFPVIQSGLN